MVLEALQVMLFGMIGIFFVMGVIIVVTTIMGGRKKKDK